MRLLFPSDDKRIFRMLTGLSGRVAHGATVFKDFVDTYGQLAQKERSLRVADIKEMEHLVDEATQVLLKRLLKSNVHQGRREALHASATLLMRCMDAMSVASRRMILYRLEETDDELKQMALLVNNACFELKSLVEQLHVPKHVQKTLTRIHGLETEADYVYNLAMARLFRRKRDARELIITKELYDILEGVVDKANYAAVALENMMIREHD